MKHTAACLVAMAAASGAALGDDVSTTDDRVEELTRLVDELRSELDAFKTADDSAWLTEQRAEEIRGLVQDVLADADTRASLLQSGMTAGHDGGFFIGSADGSFRLQIGGQIQVRYVINHRSSPPGDGDEYRWGFEVRRAKIKLKGHVLDPSWKYVLNGAYDRDGGALELEDAEIIKELDNGFAIRVGQFKIPFSREELVSSSAQLLVDRSLVNERFNADRSAGIEVNWHNDQFRVAGHVGNGTKTLNRPWNRYDTEYEFAGRIEFMGAGDWKQFKAMQGWRGGEFGWLLGGGLLYQVQEYGVFTVADKEKDFRLTTDFSMQFDGGNLFASFTWQDLDVADVSPWGVTVQGGFFVSDNVEIIGRYEYGDSDSDSQDLNKLSGGVNYYWNKNKLKWTTDFGYAFDQVTSAWDSSGVGWLTDSLDEDGQWVLRTQMQLLF